MRVVFSTLETLAMLGVSRSVSRCRLAWRSCVLATLWSLLCPLALRRVACAVGVPSVRASGSSKRLKSK